METKVTIPKDQHVGDLKDPMGDIQYTFKVYICVCVCANIYSVYLQYRRKKKIAITKLTPDFDALAKKVDQH